jgi:hypothetical protein
VSRVALDELDLLLGLRTGRQVRTVRDGAHEALLKR